ncbi:RNA binding Pelota-like protein [Anaerobacterium chartisolvens]|uniref:RNA binding Pelota-like protein n=1 Tax=Anaerobacterium chartisolvens TaxID=1297424 RepID=A0A369BAK5_9FIRM|nr:cysteine protease StiP family protein [Anaerobacterium chartisolvens]RCX17596.1 RNA binding Pelota-like protein [Anaerobacterium chartisolvens]
MKSSYSEDDVIVLLKDVSGMVEPLGTSERERRIQTGTHYSEMLPIEYRPSPRYMRVYNESLSSHSMMTAYAVGNVAEKIIERKGRGAVLVSLARAGTPVGILIKRYLQKKYGIRVPHYTISIIRGRGIDHNAMKHILKLHSARDIQFVDGWTGKGAIFNELKRELEAYPGVSHELAVLADPAWITELCGTHEDFLIPSSCLNSTVSGLLSRTFLNNSIIGENDFHGAVYYRELENEDMSYDFISRVEGFMNYDGEYESQELGDRKGMGLREVEKIAEEFGIKDINFVKPGIGETTRVLLRRVPWKILVREPGDTKYLSHILRLAEEKQVEVIQYPLAVYRACGIIKALAADT